jgi:hypothetical protein
VDFYTGGDVACLTWGFPVMVSHGRLRRQKTLPRATAPWVCDSRGFTELSQHGRWTITAEQYATALRRYATDVGRLVWASPQDWMCEPHILAKTGLTVADHQARTVASVAELRELVDGAVHVIPVLQGWALPDYLAHIDQYAAAGIDLFAEPVVGLGSVCRRQRTGEIHAIVETLAGMGLRLHGFGVKTAAIEAVGDLLASADSAAWSAGARHRTGRCPHPGSVRWEANCPQRAAAWRERVLARLGVAEQRPQQLSLPI